MSSAVLAIEVTGPGGGAALAVGDHTEIGLIPPAVARGRDLIPQVETLLRDANLDLRELVGIACAVGPGSFTGIRIGIATAATLAYAAQLPVVAIGSLHGIGLAHAASGDVCVALNARRDHVFAARFQDGKLLGEYRHILAARIAEELRETTIVLGDARTAYPTIFDRFQGNEDATVRPGAIAQLGAAAFQGGEAMQPAELRPLYLRLSDPELRREEQLGRAEQQDGREPRD